MYGDDGHYYDRGPDFNELEAMYQGGYLDFLREPLRRFVQEKKQAITNHRNALQSRFKRNISLDTTIRLFIFEKKGIDLYMENMDQKAEIEKEVWIIHETNPNPSDTEIFLEWSNKYAAMWREYRVRSMLYLYHKEKEDFLRLLE